MCFSQDGQSRTVRQFQFTDWPEQGVPKSGEGFIDFVGQVHKTKEQFGQDGPITVHCRCACARNNIIELVSQLVSARHSGYCAFSLRYRNTLKHGSYTIASLVKRYERMGWSRSQSLGNQSTGELFVNFAV